MYCGWLGFELIFVIIFTIETRGKTSEEIAVHFDGERKPDRLPQMSYDITTFSMDNSINLTSGIERGEEDFICTCKARRAAEVYELQLVHPQRVMEKDRLGYGRGRVRVL